MNDPLKQLAGIGDKIAKNLNQCGIMTIGDLSRVKPGSLAMPGLEKWIRCAQDYLKHTPSESFQRKVQVGPKGEINEPQSAKCRYELKEHTWYRQVVSIPHPHSSTENRKIEAVIFEMVLDPNERVSMSCTWIDEMKNPKTGEMEEVECTHTYSPVLLMHINPHLKELRCNIAAEDIASIPYNALINALWECDQLLRT